MSDADILAAVVRDDIGVPFEEHNEHALHDYTLPAIVRGFIAINLGSATETMAIREAGFMPRLYGTYKEERVRITMVSRLGDVGISREDKDHGYFKRCSIYDLSDFSDTMLLTPPAKQPSLKYTALADSKDRWIAVRDDDPGEFKVVNAPQLYVEASSARTALRGLDPFGLKQLRGVPVKLTIEKE